MKGGREVGQGAGIVGVAVLVTLLGIALIAVVIERIMFSALGM